MHLPHTFSEDRGRRATLLLILGIAILVPSLAWPGAEGFYGIRPVIIQGAALGLLLLLASRATWSPDAVRRFLRTGPNLPILLFLGWSAISCLHSPDRAHGLQQLLQLVGGAIVYFAVVYRVSSRRQVQHLVGGLAGAVIASVLLAGILLPEQSDGRAAGAFLDSQLYASFLLLMLPLMLVTGYAEEPGPRRLAAQVATVFGLAALLFTLNRSTWLGAMVGVWLLGVLAVRYSGGLRGLAGRGRLIVVPVAAVCAALALFFVVTNSMGAVAARLAGVTTDSSLSWRTDAWAAAYRMFLVHPLAGWGMGAYAVAADRFGAPGLQVAVRHGLPISIGETAHNQYAQLLAETGVIGLLLYLAVLGGFFRSCWRQLTQDGPPTRKWLIIGAMAAVAAQVVDAIGNPSYQFAEVSLFFWLVLGIGVALSRPREERETAAAAEPAARRVLPLPARAGWVLAQAVILLVGILTIERVHAAGGSTGIPSCYTGIKSCTLSPSNAFILQSPGAPNCQQYTLSVTFNLCGGGTQTVDVTNDPATTFTVGCSTCVTQSGTNRNTVCLTNSTDPSCTCRQTTVTGTFSTTTGNCSSSGQLLLKPAFGGCTTFRTCP